MKTIFLGGSPRSGTTLLQSVLCSDKQTNPLIREVTYLASMLGAYRMGKTYYTDEVEDYFQSREDLQQFSAEWTIAFLEKVRQRYAPATCLVLQSPELTKYFPELHELLPDAQFLISVRDPRDTIASLIEVGEKMKHSGTTAQQKGAFLQTRDVAQLSRLYRSYYTPALKETSATFRDRLRFVKYEGLTSHTATVLEQLRSFSGLELQDFNPAGEWQRNTIDFQQLSEADRPWWSNELYGKAIANSRIGRYRQILSVDEIAIVERECQDILHLFSYSSVS